MPKRGYSVKEEVLDVDDDLRCRRSDGRKWRCRRRAMPGVTFCEYHRLRINSNSEIQELGRSLDSMGEDSDSDPEEAAEELLRVAIKRQLERRKRREKRMEREKETVVRMNLPNGVMVFSSSPDVVSRNAGDIVDCKVGLGFGGDNLLPRRRFRSKNVEPAPLGPVKKLPRVSGRRPKKVFNKCSEASCKTSCMHRGAIDSGSKGKLGRTNYFICQKLPIQHLNWEQMSELEIEANNQGRKLSGVQLEVAEYDVNDEQLKCNSCRISIGDLHRSCSKCSYKLCLSCCQEIRKGSLLSGVSCRFLNGTKVYKHVGKTSDGVENNFDILHSPVGAEERDKNTDDNMSCPSSEHGGCSDGILNMKFLLPFDWRSRGDLIHESS